MAISINHNYIKIQNNNTQRITYSISEIDFIKHRKLYDKQFNGFLSTINSISKEQRKIIDAWLYDNNISTDEEIEQHEIPKTVEDATTIIETLKEDVVYLISCFNGKDVFDKTKLNNLEFLYEQWLKDEWFLDHTFASEIVEDDTITSTNIKDKYEYLKRKFPGCKDC